MLFTYTEEYLDEFVFSGVDEGLVELLVLCEYLLCAEQVHAEVADDRLEEVVLRAVPQQVALVALTTDLHSDD